MTIQKASRQGGFTLIELIVVIIVLGILAATAAPKFIDFGKDARVSTLNGLEAAVEGTNSMVYGKAAMSGVQKQRRAKVDIFDEGQLPNNHNVAYGYLQADALVDALKLDACSTAKASRTRCENADWIYETDGKNTVFYPADTYQGANASSFALHNTSCSLTYTEAKRNSEPKYVINEEGC